MIFGDPINFAILMKYIPQWSQKGSYKNGMFHFIIDSAIFPEVAGVATLGGDVHCVKSDNALVRPVDDSEKRAQIYLSTLSRAEIGLHPFQD